VQVSVTNDASGILLSVQDNGPGMTEDQIRHLGERFFRVLGNTQPGSGLGWSIVKRIADVSGASVLIGRAPALGGLEVKIRWPAPTSATQ
jgi:two-component system sensor histidine kinase QseC